jgi:hypothetical protein
MLLAIPVRIPHLPMHDELLESLHFARRTDEPVSQQLLGSGPTGALFRKALSHKVSKVLAKVTCQPWWWVFGNLEQHLHGVYVAQRRFSIGHLHGGNAQGPDVCFEAVPVLLDHFRSHPERSANERIALRLDVGELGGDTKVGQLHLASI